MKCNNCHLDKEMLFRMVVTRPQEDGSMFDKDNVEHWCFDCIKGLMKNEE